MPAVCLAGTGVAQQSGTFHAPVLSHRPPPAAGIPEGKIKLDVVVTDDVGVAVAALEQKDFTLLDNKKAWPILSFWAVCPPAALQCHGRHVAGVE
jgi:hypothetical protein